MNLSEYFEKNRYKPTYFIGDRVRGKWNGIPFIGTVYLERDNKVFINSDLPIKYRGDWHTFIHVKQKDIRHYK